MKDAIITVTGTASDRTAPDQIELSLTLNVKNKDYGAMMTEAAEKAEALISALTKAGFQREDIKTAEFNIGSEYDNVQTENGSWKRQFAGYRLTHRLHLAFASDMRKLNDAVNAAADCKGANPELDIAFSVKDLEQINRRLLSSAVKDARAKAEVIAEAAGVSLGELCEINCGASPIGGVSPTMYKRQAVELCRGADMSINPESAENVLNITAAWRVEQ